MRLIKVKFGGSTRKYNRQWPLLQPIAVTLPIRVAIGSKFATIRVADTSANREIVQSAGATITNDLRE